MMNDKNSICHGEPLIEAGGRLSLFRVILLMTVFFLSISGIAFSSPLHPEPVEPTKRIISLAPSITEILYALNLDERIVAVTNFCDYPPRAKEKPKIGGMLNPSLEAIVSMSPDIVLMTTDGNPKEVDERLKQLGIKTYVFRARRLAELPEGIREMGRALGVEERAKALAGEIETRVKNLKLKTQNLKLKRSVLFIIWVEPLIVAGPGTAIDDALQLLGWENIASDTQVNYPKYSIEEVIHRSPDVILIGKPLTGIEEFSKGFLKKIASLEAVRKGRVYYTSDALYRLGPRVLEGIKEVEGYLVRSQE
ncbi:MAG: cobalamin-binding protein [Nitrospinae bacterium]|nr:cobalamin-binding protein [Nitrospinota bacterium]